MKKNFFLFLIFTLINMFRIKDVFANLSMHHTDNIKTKNSLKEKRELIDSFNNLFIKSKKLKIYLRNKVFSFQDVDLQKGNKRFCAQSMKLYKSEDLKKLKTLFAEGDVCFINDKFYILGDKIYLNFDTEDLNIYYGKFFLKKILGYGQADFIQRDNKNQYIIFKKGIFTFCLPPNDTWNIFGSQIIYDYKNMKIKIWKAFLFIKKIPVLYFPYIQFSIKKSKSSGFLIPKLLCNKNTYRLKLQIPYHIKLDKNNNFKIVLNIPKNFQISLQSKLFYFNHFGEGMLKFNICPQIQRKYFDKNKQKIFWIYWKHNKQIKKNHKIDFEYYKNNISQNSYKKYFKNQKNKFLLYNLHSATYNLSEGNWNIFLSYRGIKYAKYPYNREMYFKFPYIQLSFYKKNSPRSIDLKIFSKIKQYGEKDSKISSSNIHQMYIIPSIFFLSKNKIGNINTNIKYTLVYSKKNNFPIDIQNNIHTRHKKIHIFPEFQIIGKSLYIFTFSDLLMHKKWIQTIEPELRYFYYSDSENNLFNVFNTKDKNLYFQNFRYNRRRIFLNKHFSHQKFFGKISTHFYNLENKEKFNISLEQLYLIDKSNFFRNAKNYFWIGKGCIYLNNQWTIQGSIQMNKEFNHIFLNFISLKYEKNNNKIIKLIVHNGNINYDDWNTPFYFPKKLIKKNASKIGISGKWRFLQNFSIVGTMYFNTHKNQKFYREISLQYKNCCLHLNINYSRTLIDWHHNLYTKKYSNKISFNIKL